MGYGQSVAALVAPVIRHLDEVSPGDVLGVYLFGSAASSGIRPESDIDLLVLTRRSLSSRERRDLTDLLLAVSGWRGHAARFPDAQDRRPIELTSLTAPQPGSWAGAPLRDFQYGEWLREGILDGHVPMPENDPDVTVLIATAHQAHRVLLGQPLGTLLPAVPSEALREAILASVPEVLACVEGDERNTLLTLARILVTLDTGRIVSKDAAAKTVANTLTGADRALMERARSHYLGIGDTAWDAPAGATTALARLLADRAAGPRSS